MIHTPEPEELDAEPLAEVVHIRTGRREPDHRAWLTHCLTIVNEIRDRRADQVDDDERPTHKPTDRERRAIERARLERLN